MFRSALFCLCSTIFIVRDYLRSFSCTFKGLFSLFDFCLFVFFFFVVFFKERIQHVILFLFSKIQNINSTIYFLAMMKLTGSYLYPV